SSSAKNSLKAQVSAVVVGTNTCLGCAVQTANAELISNRGRANGRKYIVLFSGSEEGPSPIVSNLLNGTVFTSAKANDAATAVEPNSQLNASISSNIRYFTVNFGSSATACSGTGGANYSMGCSLLRFAASKTNKANLTSGFNWASDYKSQISGSSNAIDGAYHYNAASSDQLNSAYLAILSAIEGVPAGLVAVEKLASQASYLETNYVKDKGGRIYPHVLTNSTQDGSTLLTYNIIGVPETYYCDSSEPDCVANAKQSGAGQYYIENNFLNINIKVSFNSFGKFDLDSNYSGCGTDNIQKTADNSKVDYFSSANSDPINNGSKYKSFTFSSLCINVTSGGTAPKISKITKDDKDEKKATFEAGDLVKVKLEIDESESARSDYVIEDFVPASANGAISYKFSRQNDGFTKEGIGATASGGKVKFTGTDELKLMHGKNFIEYSFRI
ncbi:MAG: hypothetical protein Q8M92_03665, partial [Candidatus Subteraquimicrobiales bacterium]|nr:hypothetical protein [Candidatus Subteraquimicrobiales bacterium]